jgi:hypothetical protein
MRALALGPSPLRVLVIAIVAASVAVAPLACSPSSSMPPAPDAGGDASAEAACPSDLPAICPSPAPGYDAAVLPLLARRCWGCHGDGGIEVSQHDLGTYDGVFAQRRAVLDQVYGCLMPPSDAAALTADERAALLGWLVCGAPHN